MASLPRLRFLHLQMEQGEDIFPEEMLSSDSLQELILTWHRNTVQRFSLIRVAQFVNLKFLKLHNLGRLLTDLEFCCILHGCFELMELDFVIVQTTLESSLSNFIGI